MHMAIGSALIMFTNKLAPSLGGTAA
jgi:hypothetical protein